MIRSFRDKETRRVFERNAGVNSLAAFSAALRKLLLLDAAETLDDLRAVPGNHLEKLSGNRGVN